MTRCSVPAVHLASLSFQDAPQPIELRWVRQEHHGVLTTLDHIADPAERTALFEHYLHSTIWGIDGVIGKRPDIDISKVLRGWGIDSNGISGAILKAWVQDRFGLRPIFHRTPLVSEDAQERYATEGYRGVVGPLPRQLDFLYVYTQDELRRRYPHDRWLTCWRGTYDPERYEVKIPGVHGVVEFNAISSFTINPEIAWEFGSEVWRVRVPREKILVFPGSLPPQFLQGEQECLVLGGDYRVDSELG